MHDPDLSCAAFSGDRLIAAGPLGAVARAVAEAADPGSVVILADASGHTVDLDLRGSPDEVVGRLPQPPPRGRGRPKLGVQAREVTLLPRHWSWLARQPGGASVALRKLVEAGMRDPAEEARAGREAAYRAMTVLGGNRPGYEEAIRALFAGDTDGFRRETAAWPTDIREYVLRLARLS